MMKRAVPNFQKIFGVPAPFTRFKRSVRDTDTAADKLCKLLAAYYKQDDDEAEDDAADDVRRAVTRDDLDAAIGDVTGSDGDDGNGRHHVGALADLMVEASDGELSRSDALRWLLHDKRGAALLRRVRAAKWQQQEEKPMDTMATLTSYVKKTGGGLTAIAKHVSDAGTANLTEAQFTQLIGVEAAKRYPNDRSDVAFSKFFTAPENAIVRQAHAIIKNYPVLVNVKPMQTGGAAAVASADEGQAAYDKLMAMAAELARTNPALSISQAFSRVAAELKNKDLLAASVLRTRARATSAYPGQP